ncbi:TetR/AcrR family transcriptional regulator [Alkalicoccus chagannorensis]|uniref:TetR/AcrR family transcriptional regulator n=1 Tax=Alkalicoccus chagannorensis TaxID=427072 RepID=UPI00040604A0|nr:TetR/AcrR family transcriptional regulator [Alkalicoccus chagannorensis]
MTDKFHELDRAKQELIINAALREFRSSGYEKASTNAIVKEAGISKGSLFVYFQHKRGLYDYLLDHAAGVLEEVYAALDPEEGDLFERMEQIGRQKLLVQQQWPDVFDFLWSLQEEGSAEVGEEARRRLASLYERGYAKMYENMDYSLFREDIDPQKAVEVVHWTMNGFGSKQLAQMESFADMDPEAYMAEWRAYAALLKRSFYR